MTNHITIFDSAESKNPGKWRIVDDVVMGGRSDGNIAISNEGYAVFSGRVSLENNGGFSSVRLRVDFDDISKYSAIRLRLRGDAKSYQLRIKSNRWDRHSYKYQFSTSAEWETIMIPLNEMEPTFRGRKLRMPNFESGSIQEIAFLISNKKAEEFKLEIDKIELVSI